MSARAKCYGALGLLDCELPRGHEGAHRATLELYTGMPSAVTWTDALTPAGPKAEATNGDAAATPATAPAPSSSLPGDDR